MPNNRKDRSKKLSDILIDSIRKASKFGCSIRQIATLFNVSNNTIYKAYKEPYQVQKQGKLRSVSEDDDFIDKIKRDGLLAKKEEPYKKQLIFKNKIRLDGDEVIIIRLESELAS